jgi:hypothetical protein
MESGNSIMLVECAIVLPKDYFCTMLDFYWMGSCAMWRTYRVGHQSVTAGFGPKNPKPTITIEEKISPITDQLVARFCRVADRSGVG